jgi:hypothetical protein
MNEETIKTIDKFRLASNIVAVTDENNCTTFYYTGCISLEFYLSIMADIENEGLFFAKEFFKDFSGREE